MVNAALTIYRLEWDMEILLSREFFIYWNIIRFCFVKIPRFLLRSRNSVPTWPKQAQKFVWCEVIYLWKASYLLLRKIRCDQLEALEMEKGLPQIYAFEVYWYKDKKTFFCNRWQCIRHQWKANWLFCCSCFLIGTKYTSFPYYWNWWFDLSTPKRICVSLCLRNRGPFTSFLRPNKTNIFIFEDLFNNSIYTWWHCMEKAN